MGKDGRDKDRDDAAPAAPPSALSGKDKFVLAPGVATAGAVPASSASGGDGNGSDAGGPDDEVEQVESLIESMLSIERVFCGGGTGLLGCVFVTFAVVVGAQKSTTTFSGA